MARTPRLAIIRGDGIGGDVTDATLAIAAAALKSVSAPEFACNDIDAGAAYFSHTGKDIEPGGEERAGDADAIFLGAIGLPSVRHADGTAVRQPGASCELLLRVPLRGRGGWTGGQAVSR